MVLSLNAGYVDTAGFLALKGLFTAHVTGNFVTLAAAMVFGRSGAVAKILALPVFCVVVIAARFLDYDLPRFGYPVLRTKLVLQLLLLVIAAAMAIVYGPFANVDGLPALITGMTLVSAMAIQNKIHRTHLGSTPPTTLMTGTTTQIMIDVADIMRGLPADAQAATKSRLSKMSVSVTLFALGCGLAGVAFTFAEVRCFVVPPALSLFALLLSTTWEDKN